MSASPGSVVYVVERLNWQFLQRGDQAHGEQSSVWEGYLRLPGSTRLRSFADYEEARRFLAEREEEVRARANPFACGGPALHYQTSLDEGRLHDWLLDAGVEPPAPRPDGKRDWRTWWDGVAPALSPEQRARCWQAFDRVRFHDLVERPARPTAFIVVERHWQYNDNWYECGPEGGTPVRAYTTWEQAEKARARQEADSQRTTSWYGYAGREITARVSREIPPFQPLPERSDGSTGYVFAEEGEDAFFEIIEVELEG
jgi:hypothetical protein